MKEITIVLAGIGGYGAIYAGQLFQSSGAHGERLVAGVDPYPEKSPYYEAFRQAGLPLYPDLESFYRSHSADLAIVSAAIHLHHPLTCLALEHGSAVLCEKPLSATLAEARQMAEAERRAGKFVAIGYQWSFSAAVQALKRELLAGVLGRPLRLKTKVFWPRPASYFRRNDWAGRIRTSGGAWVLDSPLHNATAHYLHNMLYLLGSDLYGSVEPAQVQAEKYRANEIENYDAAALRVRTTAGAELLFYTAHCVADTLNPTLVYEFERGVVEYPSGEEGAFVARFPGGRTHSYGNPFADEANKLWQAVEAAREGVCSGSALACGIQAALPQLQCMQAAQTSGEITSFPPHLVRRNDLGGRDSPDFRDAPEFRDALVWVEGLQEAFEQAYDRNALPSELGGFPWARPGRLIDVASIR